MADPAPSDTLEVSSREVEPGAVVLAPVGDIDFGSHEALRAAAADALARGRVRLVLDLSGVRICDSTGLSMFVDLHRQTRERGGWLRLAATRPLLAKTLGITRLDGLLPIYGTVDAALAA
jgi:anti-anti-sigma factor